MPKSTKPRDRRKYWLIDHMRTSTRIKPKARFEVVQSDNPPMEYYKGPLSKTLAGGAKNYLEKCWGATCD